MDLNERFYLWQLSQIFFKYLALWGQHVVRQCVNIDGILGVSYLLDWFTLYNNLFWSLTANMNLHVVKLPSFFEVVFVLFWVGNSLGAPWSKHLGEQFPWKSFWGQKFVSRHLYSGCFTMSPSSITSLPPSLPSLAKSWSVEIFSFNFSPYLSVGKVEIHLFFCSFFQFLLNSLLILSEGEDVSRLRK